MKLKALNGNGGPPPPSVRYAASGIVQEGRRNRDGRRIKTCRLCPAYFPLVNKTRGGRSGNSIS